MSPVEPTCAPRVIDYYGTQRWEQGDRVIVPKATIVRRRTRVVPSSISPWATLVDYAVLDESEWVGLNVPQVRHWVLHVNCSRAYDSLCASFELALPSNKYDMTIVFNWTGARGPLSDTEVAQIAEDHGDLPRYPGDVGIFNDLKGAVFRAAVEGTVTVVGLDSLAPQALAMAADTKPADRVEGARQGLIDELRLSLDRGFFNFVPGKSEDEAVEHILANIRWLTLDEWVASLPDDEKVVASMPTFCPPRSQWPGGPNDDDFRDPMFSDEDLSDEDGYYDDYDDPLYDLNFYDDDDDDFDDDDSTYGGYNVWIGDNS
jgi:hypothetical protein